MPADHRGRSIFHIVHIDRLESIATGDGLLSDAAMRKCAVGTTIGMNDLKDRRLTLPVKVFSDLTVGGCVPFYFCSRSIMLFVLYCANHPQLAYRGGQRPIVHLEANLGEAIDWAESTGRRWAVSLVNASARYATFRAGSDGLNDVNWAAVASTDFRQAEIKEAKQAEFLVEGGFPWTLVRRIGVIDHGMADRVAFAIRAAQHRPQIAVLRDWYY